MPWVRLPIRQGEEAGDVYERLSLNDAIVEIAPEFTYREAATPNDPAFVDQWHLGMIGADQAWEYSLGSGVTVAVIDSGVSTGGEDLTCHTFAHPYNAFTGETNLLGVADDSGHGTHVTGTIAQCTNNGIGAAGVAPAATIMPIKALNAGTGTSLEVANGILWAADHGADVINLSLGRSCSTPWPTCSDLAVDSAIEYARDADILVVVATGNEGSQWVSSPANHPASLAVGATTTVDSIATYSNFGEAIDVVAPGGNFGDLDGNLRSDGIFQESFDVGGWGILERRGTSSAAPHAAGVAALVLSIDPSLTAGALESILSSTAVDLGSSGWDPVYGAGRIDAAAAVAAALPPVTVTSTYVLGGTAAVSERVLVEIADLIGTVPTRLFGANRYETAAAISATVHPTGADTAYIVSGERFPDALAVGPVAALQDAPILLVTRTSVPQATAIELQRLAPSEIVVVGGPAAVGDEVLNRLVDLGPAGVTRIAGADRYLTAAAVAQAAFPTTADSVVLATGENFPDGLAAGPAAAALHSPILLSTSTSLPPATRAELVRLSPESVVIVGGTNALSHLVEEQVRALGTTVQRIAGSDRYGTAAALSDAYFSAEARPLLLASGEAFPDALSGAAIAGSLGGPMLLTKTDLLPAVIASELTRFFS